jgi:hypothetical protein
MLNGLRSGAEINPNVIKLGDFWVVGAAFQPRFQVLGESFFAAGKLLPLQKRRIQNTLVKNSLF